MDAEFQDISTINLTEYRNKIIEFNRNLQSFAKSCGLGNLSEPREVKKIFTGKPTQPLHSMLEGFSNVISDLSNFYENNQEIVQDEIVYSSEDIRQALRMFSDETSLESNDMPTNIKKLMRNPFLNSSFKQLAENNDESLKNLAQIVTDTVPLFFSKNSAFLTQLTEGKISDLISFSFPGRSAYKGIHEKLSLSMELTQYQQLSINKENTDELDSETKAVYIKKLAGIEQFIAEKLKIQSDLITLVSSKYINEMKSCYYTFSHLLQYPHIIHLNPELADNKLEKVQHLFLEDSMEKNLFQNYFDKANKICLHFCALTSEIHALLINKDNNIIEPEFNQCSYFETFYKRGTKLGEGSFGIVFQAKDLYNANCAVKRIKFSSLKFDEAIRDIYKEGIFMRQLKHDNIVLCMSQWFEYNYNPSIPHSEFFLFIDMELCDTSLEKRVKGQKNVDFNESLIALIDILSGVDFLHKNNFIHRDIKPGNILVKKRENRDYYLLGDFGLVRKLPKNIQKQRMDVKQNSDSNDQGKPGVDENISINSERYSDENSARVTLESENSSDNSNELESENSSGNFDEEDIATMSDVGTVGYAAPELSLGKYNEKIDIYSVGRVIRRDLFNSIQENIKAFREIDRISKIMVDEDYRKRMSAEEALKEFKQLRKPVELDLD